LFNKINEPDLVRDAVFDIEVRDTKSSESMSYLLAGFILLIVAVAAFWAGRVSMRWDDNGVVD